MTPSDPVLLYQYYRNYLNYTAWIAVCFFAVFGVLSVSRVTALYQVGIAIRLKERIWGFFILRLLNCIENIPARFELFFHPNTGFTVQHYQASTEIWMKMGELDAGGQHTTQVCVGKEWHRFPSSFFFPDKSFRLAFLKSEFRGQLPK